MSQEFQVQCRGLPWETTESELRNFFGNSDIASVDIPRRNGRASGDATVTFNSEAAYKDALKKDREHLGSRYIEVFSMDSAPRRRGGDRDDFRGSRPPRDRFSERRSGGGGASGPDSVVRLRGLPFSVTVRDITDFLAPLPIVRDGVLLPDQQRARPGGEAYVCFETMESVQIAKQRHMKNIGHRYIEVFESSFRDLSRFADDNNLRVPRFGPPPFVSGPPRGAYDPYADGYRREHTRAPDDPYRREYSQRPYDGGYQSAPAPTPSAQNPYSPAAPPAQGPGAGYGYDAYQPKPYEYGRGEPRDPAPAHRERDMGRGGDPRGGAPLDPYTGQERYAEYGGSSAPVGGASSGGGGANGYDYWRGGSSVGGGAGGGGGGAPPSRDPYLGDSWASGGGGGGAPQDRDRYGGGGGYPSEPYQQREAGGAMRRPDYGRPDDRNPRQEPYGYSRDHRPDYGRSAGPPPPQQQSGQQFILRMRGIPFRATEADVYDFFHPARPNQVEMLKDAYQRMSGDARVVFYNRKDYDDALMKDKQYMGERYIEIIPDNGRY